MQPVNKFGFIINVLVNLRTGAPLISIVTVPVAIEEMLVIMYI